MAKRKKKKEKNLGKNEKRSRVKRYPLTIERQYQRELSRTIAGMHKIIKEELLPELQNLTILAKTENARFDDSAETLFRVLGDVKSKIATQYPEELIESLAQRRGMEVSEYNLNTLRMQAKQVQGVDVLLSDRALQSKMTTFVRQNVNLIETVHQSYFKDVQTIVSNGVSNGESVASMSQKISKRTGVHQNRAKLIARDQTGKLNSDLNASRQAELGVKKFVWETVGDERVRESHEDLNGRVFSYREGATVDGESGVLPGQPINCRCIAQPVFEIR